MFSPVGTKKIMLENYRRSLSSGESVSTMLSKDNLSVNNSTTKNSSSPSFKRGTSMESFLSDMSDASITSSTSSSSSPLRIAQKGQYNFIRNHYELKKLLKETSLRGQVIQKIANIAMKFDKERDGILLNAFDTNYLNYEDFRILLKRILNIELTNEEFQELCQLLDNQQQHIINGVEFLIILTILSNHKKNQKRQKNYQEKRQNEQNSLKVQQNKQLARMTSIEEAAIDYSGNSNDLEKGLEKVHDAAARYDRTHHTAKSLKAFERAYMTPIEFRDALKGTFDITLTPKELGALVMHYSTDDEEYRVPCNPFVVSFLRYGYDYRLQQRSKQIEETRRTEERLRKEQEMKLLKQIESFDATRPDFDYTDQDTQSMLNKIKDAAKKYDKNHPSAVSLDGFNSKYLTPGEFRITLYRTFHIELTDKELGSLVHMFDMNRSVRSVSPVSFDSDGNPLSPPSRRRFKRSGSSLDSTSGDNGSEMMISTHDFLVHFIRVGYEERSKIRTHHLEHERNELNKAQNESNQKILQQWRIDNENFNPTKYYPQDYQTAMRKITREAERYHSEHVSAPDLSLFNGSDMNPAEFREMIKRQLNIQLSYEEIASLLPLIGSKTKEKMISTSEFIIKFKAIGWESRQQKRAKQLERIAKKKVIEEKELKKKKEKLMKELNEIVDYNFTEADRQSAISKMKHAANKYDKNHSGSMSLDAFLGRSMEPGIFSRLLKTVLHVTLTGKELGAIVSIYDNDGDGQIDSAEFLSHFFGMQRECRNNVRLKKLQRLKEKEEEDRRRYMERERLKHSSETMRLKYTSADEDSLLKKILDVGKKFAIDNASFLEHLKIFKGPAMNSTAFYQTFFRIFLVKLTFPEIGALMHRVNPKMHEINMMDGSSFITWLQKLGRISEDILLGKIDEKSVTLDDFNFTEPPTPSAIATPLSRSPSSSHGTVLSLPNIKSKNRNSSPPPRSTLFSSPSTEIITSERTVSRGVGGEESISPTLTSQSRNSPARAAHSPSPSFILDELDFDPYLPYMAHSFDLFPNHKRSHNNDHQEEFQGSLCSPSSYSTSSFFDSTRNDSVVSVVTETPSMFSPIRAQTASSSSPNQPMVASLLGQNPWQDINPHQKRGRRPKTQSSALAHTH